MRIVLGMQQGSPGYDALKLRCANRKAMLTSSNAARASVWPSRTSSRTDVEDGVVSIRNAITVVAAGPGSSSTASESSDHQLALRAGSCTICAPHCAVSAGRTGERGGEC